MSLDIDQIKKDFPILSRLIRGKRLVYLDNAATTQKPESVLKALDGYYRRHNANIHRGVHTLSEEATTMVDEARSKIARFIDAPSAHSVIFTRNATEAINLVAYAWGRKFLKAGDEILLTEMEHHSNLVPWQILAQEKKVTLRFIPMEADGTLDLEKAARLITEKTKLLSFTAVSNALGTVNPVGDLLNLARQKGVRTLVDASQWIPHRATSVRIWNADFVVFSGHKMLGPTGIGVLYGKEDLLDEMNPFLGGGDMIQEVFLDHSTYNTLPHKFEAGTPNIAAAIGLGAAVDYLTAIGFDAIVKHEENLSRLAWQAAQEESEVVVYGPTDLTKRSAVVSFNIADVHPHDVGQIFDGDGVAVRAGHHCCQPLMRKLQTPGTARASFYLYNDEADVEAFARSLKKVKEFFKVPAGRQG